MNALRRNAFRVFLTKDFSGGSGSKNTTASSAPPTQTIPDVPGLSSNVIQPAGQPVGPGVEPNKSGTYKVPEYYQYDNMSFFEAEIEMSRFRCPQPSAVQK